MATKGGNGNERRNMLRAELDSLRDKQAGNKSSRGKVLDQIKAYQENIQKKVSWLLFFLEMATKAVSQIKDLQAAKAKIPYKTVAEVDARIA